MPKIFSSHLSFHVVVLCWPLAFLLVQAFDPIPQDLAYHDFAASGSYFGIPNFWNVVTNLALVAVGAWGIRTEIGARPVRIKKAQAAASRAQGAALVSAKNTPKVPDEFSEKGEPHVSANDRNSSTTPAAKQRRQRHDDERAASSAAAALKRALQRDDDPSAILPADRAFERRLSRSAELTFFAGLLLTGIASAHYHLAPTHQTLFWDRLPMTVAFMAIFVVVLGRCFPQRAMGGWLVTAVLIGVAALVYWIEGESRGAGDLRYYAVVQFLPMILIPAMILLRRPTSLDRKTLALSLALYLVAKICEVADEALAARLPWHLTGHALKHLFAAAAALAVAHAIAPTQHPQRPR